MKLTDQLLHAFAGALLLSVTVVVASVVSARESDSHLSLRQHFWILRTTSDVLHDSIHTTPLEAVMTEKQTYETEKGSYTVYPMKRLPKFEDSEYYQTVNEDGVYDPERDDILELADAEKDLRTEAFSVQDVIRKPEDDGLYRCEIIQKSFKQPVRRHVRATAYERLCYERTQDDMSVTSLMKGIAPPESLLASCRYQQREINGETTAYEPAKIISYSESVCVYAEEAKRHQEVVEAELVDNGDLASYYLTGIQVRRFKKGR